MSTPLDIDAIRARAEAATDGPWETVPTVGNAVVSPDGDGYWSDVADRIETEADAEFIAHAREDVPALLAEVERLRADRDAQGRFLSTVDEFARVGAMSHDAVLEAVGVKAERDRAEATIARVRKLSWELSPADGPRIRAITDPDAAIEGTDS